MIFQRDKSIKVWGWADKGESVSVQFNGKSQKAKADKNGKWNIMFKPMQYGGEYSMIIKGKNNTITLNNILIGDIWICSGQSNMEWLLKAVNNAEKEIANANYPQIRSFNVTREMALEPQADFKGRWQVCSPQTAGDFSAVGFFFARKLHEATNIPIGFVNTSWGGTIVEAWTSPQSFSALSDKYKEGFDFDPAELKRITERKVNYERAVLNDMGTREKWFDPKTDISDWQRFYVPRIWNVEGLSDIDGVVWFQYEFALSDNFAGKQALVSLGKVDDNDETWINGVKVGSTDGSIISRKYQIPASLLKGGINRVTMKIVDTGGGGGIYGKEEDVYLDVEGVKVALSGEWKYKVAESTKKYGFAGLTPNSYPTSLYNAMIHPIINFPIKGAIWYQGESNSNKAYDYRRLFPNMITDWRNKWGEEFPFYWVQLANFMEEDDQPKDSSWAELREAQTMTLSLPNTGQAVIIDIGDAKDIHPRNKQDVGLRLALIALNKDYGKKDVIYSGPVFKSAEVDGNKMILTFDTYGSELVVRSKYGYLTGFSIAGSDKKFVWAKAYLSEGKVIVSSDEVLKPEAVRYDWGNNPEGNLYNKENLPTGPFRTDSWKGITEK